MPEMLKRCNTKNLPVVIMMLLFYLPVFGQDYAESQNKIKAIYLYNFIRNIEWSSAGTENFKVCLLKKDNFYTDLEKVMMNRKKGTRNILIEEMPGANDCRKCDLVFLEEKQNEQITKLDARCSSLFVTDGFYEKSFSDIVLLYHENKLNFSVNMELCAKNGFKIPSEFLLLANQKLIQP